MQGVYPPPPPEKKLMLLGARTFLPLVPLIALDDCLSEDQQMNLSMSNAIFRVDVVHQQMKPIYIPKLISRALQPPPSPSRGPHVRFRLRIGAPVPGPACALRIGRAPLPPTHPPLPLF